MKLLNPLAVLCSTVAMISSAFALQPGDPVSLEALGKAKFIHGAAPTAWEPGKLYFIECWATWCGPCIAAIPHVNALHKKFADQGLRVIGLNVWDDPYEKAEKFVTGKGEAMSYPVAFVGKGGAFETEWLTPAEVTGIPHTFLVRDGKLLATQHPGQLTDAVIGKLLAGGESETAALAAIARQKEDRAATNELYKAISSAQAAKDPVLMEAKIEALSKYPSAARSLPQMKLSLARLKSDWPGALAAIALMPDDVVSLMPLARFAADLSQGKTPVNAPEEVSRAVVAKMLKAKGDKPGTFDNMIPLVSLQAKIGDNDGALKTAREFIAKSPRASSVPMKRYAAEIEKGNIPTLADFHSWHPQPQITPAGKK